MPRRARNCECTPERVVDLEIMTNAPQPVWLTYQKKISTFLQQSAADIVVTHAYEGAHPDHDATAFATHAAMRLMKQNGFKPPVLFEMGLHPSEDFKAKVPDFLPGADRETTTLLLDERANGIEAAHVRVF